MPYDVFERSRWGGRPFHLFVFQRQGLLWRFTNRGQDLVLGGQTYATTPISRSELRDSGESMKNNVTITMPYLRDPDANNYPVTQEFGNNWRPFPPSDRIFVSCMAMHEGDSAAAVEWMGRVVAPRFKGGTLELTCEPTRSSGRRTGQQQRFQRSCWKTLYQCGVDKNDHQLDAVLTAVAGVTLSAAAFGALPSGRLAGGFLEWDRDDGLVEKRTIMSHVGSTITIEYGAQDLAVALAVRGFPGCAHNWDACDDYENTDNYGGALYLPVKNPMGGDPVW
jgi:hypothetical protein